MAGPPDLSGGKYRKEAEISPYIQETIARFETLPEIALDGCIGAVNSKQIRVVPGVYPNSRPQPGFDSGTVTEARQELGNAKLPQLSRRVAQVGGK